MPPEQVIPILSSRQRLVLVVLVVLSVAASAALVFGPGRGAREDIGSLRTDMHASRGNIADTLAVSRRTLDELSAQLKVTQSSLEIQQQGLSVAQSSQRIAGSTARSTDTIRRQTAATLATVRQVVAALGPLRKLRGDVATVVKGVQAGVVLARTTLDVGRQTLRNGKQALAVAITTLDTLKRSERIQEQLLAVGRQTLQQVVEINRKIPTPPIFPATTSEAVPAP